MAGDAGVVRSDIIHLRRIEDVRSGRVGYVLAAWTVAAFATNVPLGGLLRVDVIAD